MAVFVEVEEAFSIVPSQTHDIAGPHNQIPIAITSEQIN